MDNLNPILFDFDSIIDLQLSYINYYMNKYKKNPYNMNMRKLKFQRVYNNRNLLDILEEIDDDAYYHPSFPVFTSMKNFVNKLSTIGGINSTILCKDRKQAETISNSFKISVLVLIGERKDLEIKGFSKIVVGDAYSLNEFQNVKAKHITIMNFMSNRDNQGQVPPGDIYIKYGDVNIITVADPYTEIKPPKD